MLKQGSPNAGRSLRPAAIERLLSITLAIGKTPIQLPTYMSTKTPSYLYPLTVDAEDLDEMNHVNNLRYLQWCLKAASAHSTDVGWTWQRYRESGFGFVVRAHKIKYRVPALIGDEIIVETWIDNMEKVSSDRRYVIKRTSDDKRLAEAETTWVYVDLETMELTRIPDEIRMAFKG